MKRRKKIKIQERKLGRERAWGQAYIGLNLIEIDKDIRGKRRLRTILHELAHLFFPDMSENKIKKLEKYMGDFLWEQKYRRVDQ